MDCIHHFPNEQVTFLQGSIVFVPCSLFIIIQPIRAMHKYGQDIAIRQLHITDTLK